MWRRHSLRDIRSNEKGQSLIELLFAITIGALLVGSAGVVLAVALKTSLQNKYMQSASFLAQDLMEKVATYADAKWYCTSGSCGIYNLGKGSSFPYYISTTTSPFQYVSGSATTTLDGVNYGRYFYLENVCRNNQSRSNGKLGNIGQVPTPPSCFAGNFNNPPQTEDISTQRLTVVVSWVDQGGGSLQLVRFIMRHENNVVFQGDWSGGSTYYTDTPINAASTTNTYYSATSTDSSSEPSLVKIVGS